jgi:hypothetical protein
MEIRPARIEDAAAACDVPRRSITALCRLDHHDDPAILERWLANKTPAIVAGWIAKPDSHVLVATEAGAILAVGAVTDGGEITLNYVSRVSASTARGQRRHSRARSRPAPAAIIGPSSELGRYDGIGIFQSNPNHCILALREHSRARQPCPWCWMEV